MDPNLARSLGKRLRLIPIPVESLPEHPAFARWVNRPIDTAETRPKLRDFVLEILDEAMKFADFRVRTFKVTGEKGSRGADAWVEQSHQRITRREQLETGKVSDAARDEEWFARVSRHSNAAVPGTATWNDFRQGLKEFHSEHEAEYTPDVYDAHLVMEWKELKGLTIEGYHGVDMRVFEMCHKLPPPLAPRVFPTLVVTAYHETDTFVVAQVPVDIAQLDEALYSNGKNKTKGGKDPLKQKSVVLGIYTSVERCRRNMQEASVTEWVMATASDAKGNLPMWTQKLGVPGAVLKDVGLFMGWTTKRRRGEVVATWDARQLNGGGQNGGQGAGGANGQSLSQ